MKAVIMAGGFGTRLRPITCNIPKPMVPVANIPMMEHIIDLLKRYELNRIVSILYFQPEIITKYFGNGQDFGVQMDYVMATADYGTAGSVKNSEEYLKDKPFIIISGDVLTDFDLSKAIAFHRERKAMATIVLTRVENPLEFGVVITADDGRIIRFLEKPSWGEVFSDTINTGIYILEPEIFQYIPTKTEFDFSKNLFPFILREKLPLFGFISEGYWKDIGDLKEYRLAHKDLLLGHVEVRIPGSRMNTIGRDVWVGSNSKLGKKVKLSGGVVIGANCVIEDGSSLHNAIVGDGCVIKSQAHISESILWERVYVGAKARISEAIVSSDTHIHDHASVEKGAVISEECRIGEGAIIRRGVNIWPRKVVEDGSTVCNSLVWSDKWTKSLFTNMGITGLANLEITPELASKVGAAFGSILGKGATVNTSRDSHRVSRMINRSIICGLISAGVNVTELRVTPAPVARYKLSNFGKAGEVHVCLSPNDPNQVVIKLFDSEGREVSPNQQKAIERLFHREDFSRASLSEMGDITFPNRVIEQYRDNVIQYLDVEAIRKRAFKVVVDYAFGGASTIFSAVLSKLNCEVISLNAYQDDGKLYRTHQIFKQSLNTIASVVKSLSANVGLMLDAEAEQLFFVDDTGRLIGGEESLITWAALLLEIYPQARISVPVSTSYVVESLAKKTGATVIRTKTNNTALINSGLNDKSIFCGNSQGGCIFPEFQPTFDGIVAAAKLLEVLAKQEKPLSQIVDSLPKFHLTSKQVPCPFEGKGRVMRHAMEYGKDKEIQLIDGVKIFIDDKTWVLILPDPDKPFINLTVETQSDAETHKLLDEMLEKIRHWQEAGS